MTSSRNNTPILGVVILVAVANLLCVGVVHEAALAAPPAESFPVRPVNSLADLSMWMLAEESSSATVGPEKAAGDGAVSAWGSNTSGQCNVTAPNEDFVMIVAGSAHSLGLRANGSIAAWGANGKGQCNVPSPNDGFVSVGAGWEHSLGVKANGQIVAWGRNTGLMSGAVTGQCNVPEPNSGFVKATGGMDFSLGLKADGTIVAWGSNSLGDGIPGDVSYTAGHDHLDRGATVTDAQLAAGIPITLTLTYNTPTHTVSLSAQNIADIRSLHIVAVQSSTDSGHFHTVTYNATPLPTRVFGQCAVPSPNQGFVDIAAGCIHSVGLKYDGSVVLWGAGAPDDPYGDGWNYRQSTFPSGYSNEGIVDIGATTGNTVILTSGGGLNAWGMDSGLNGVPHDISFVKMAALTSHGLALRSNGSIVAWGSNSSGQCSVPLPNADFTDIAAGGSHSLGLSAVAPRNCVQVVTPSAPYQSIHMFGDMTTMELRHEDLPQGTSLSFEIDPSCQCSSGAAILRATRFLPTSGSGRVYNVYDGNQTYFRIDNLTGTGSYDLEVECAGGAREFLPANFTYVGFVGYTPEATLRNSLTGNTIRGAKVSLWQWNGYGYNLYRTTTAGDGTYAFGYLAPGWYTILIQYELSGEQWRGPYEIGTAKRASIPYEDIDLVPVTDDIDVPALEPQGGAAVLITDSGVGLSVVEPVLASMDNLNVWVSHFAVGAGSVIVDYSLEDVGRSGSARISCVDQLGNAVEYLVTRSVASSVPDAVTGRSTLRQVGPNPFNPATVFEVNLATGSAISLVIYDVRGNSVRTLVEAPIPPGMSRVEWNGCDDHGLAVSSGVYFARLIDAGGSQTLKVTLAR